MKTAVIERAPGTDNLTVQYDGTSWRRIGGVWEMQGADDNWFACEIQYPNVRKQVEDFEFCLRTYTFEEGPDFPKGRKHFEDTGERIRHLQAKELRAACRDIFAPVRISYDAAAENRARYNRDYSSAALKRDTDWMRKYLTA